MLKSFTNLRTSRLPLFGAIFLSLVLTAKLMLTLYRPVGGGVDIFDRPIGQDFINVWAAPYLATHGQLAALFNPDVYVDLIDKLFGHELQPYVWSYPPSTLLLYYPFSLPPYFVSIALWTLLGCGLWVTVYRAYAGRITPTALGLLLLSPACAINVIDGQNGFFASALFIGGLLLLPRKPIIAGVMFGLLTFKPQIGIVLPFALVVLREWKAVIAAATTFAVFALASIMCFGVGAWVNYVTVTSGWQMGALVNLNGLASRMGVAPLIGLRALGMLPEHALAMQIAISVFVIVIVCQTLRRSHDSRQRIFLLCSSAPMVSPYLLNYDLCLIAVPVIAWLTDKPATSWRRYGLYLLAWTMPTLGLVLALGPIRALQALVPATFACVFVAAVMDVQKPHEQGDGIEPAAALS